MSNYIDKSYILSNIKESELNNLIMKDDGTVDEDYLSGRILAASSLIDSYLNGKVTLPIASPVPDVIKQHCYYITEYYLHSRIQNIDVPQRVKDNYDISINWLKDVSAGKVILEIRNEDNIIWYEAENFNIK